MAQLHSRPAQESKSTGLSETASSSAGADTSDFSPAGVAGLQGAYGNSFLTSAIFRSASGMASSSDSADPGAAFDRAASSPTSSLPHKAEMESAFGQDFSGVKAHLGQKESMGALSANAAAAGDHVAFADANPSKELVAHELTHVVQQRGGASGVQAHSTLSRPQDSAEIQADNVASAVAQGSAVDLSDISSASSGTIHRDEKTGVGAAAGVAAAGIASLSPGAMLTQEQYPVGTGTENDLKAAEAFVAGGKREQKGFIPGTGPSTGGKTGRGGFDAAYEPGSGDGTLGIEVRGAVHFIDPVTGTTAGGITPVDAGYQGIADALNGLPQKDLDKALPLFKWTSDAKKRQEWLDKLKSTIEGTWGGKFQFHVHKPGWTWVGAKVAVNIVVTGRDAGKKEATEHLSIEAVKLPNPGELDLGGSDASTLAPSGVGKGSATDAYDQKMTIGSSELTERADSSLKPLRVDFKDASKPADASPYEPEIKAWAQKFSGDPNNKASHACDVMVEGFASSSGEDKSNQELSEKRVKSVVDILRANGFENIDKRVTNVGWGETFANQKKDDSKDRYVEITPVNTGDQVVASHEFGHAFGLGDEYATKDKAGNAVSGGTGGKTGDASENDALTKKMLDEKGQALAGSIYENNDSIMSGGNEVRAQHYATFAEALRTITAEEKWALGACGPKPTVAVGDFPTPSSDPTTALA